MPKELGEHLLSSLAGGFSNSFYTLVFKGEYVNLFSQPNLETVQQLMEKQHYLTEYAFIFKDPQGKFRPTEYFTFQKPAFMIKVQGKIRHNVSFCGNLF